MPKFRESGLQPTIKISSHHQSPWVSTSSNVAVLNLMIRTTGRNNKTRYNSRTNVICTSYNWHIFFCKEKPLIEYDPKNKLITVIEGVFDPTSLGFMPTNLKTPPFIHPLNDGEGKEFYECIQDLLPLMMLTCFSLHID